MEVDWLLLGCRAVASWNMRLGSRHRTPWQRSATRTSWDDLSTFAKTERPSLVSAILAPHAEASKVDPACAADSKAVSAAPPMLARAEVADRSTLPTFVAHFLVVPPSQVTANCIYSSPTMSAGRT